MTYIHFDTDDLRKNAVPAALGYICFPVPLFACPKSPLGRFCANQGLILALAFIAIRLVFAVLKVLTGWIPLIGWAIALIGWLAQAAIILAALYLAWQTYQKKPMRLPYIGNLKIIR